MEFTPEEIKALKKFAHDRLLNSRMTNPVSLNRKYPTTRSVRIPIRLLELVMEKEPNSNFNAIVETLLFEFVGSPEELLKKKP